jgi:hypothetical protein
MLYAKCSTQNVFFARIIFFLRSREEKTEMPNFFLEDLPSDGSSLARLKTFLAGMETSLAKSTASLAALTASLARSTA